jgi:hypothetical protein
LWNGFNGGAAGTHWCYGALGNIFSSVMPGRLSDRLLRAVTAFWPCSANTKRIDDPYRLKIGTGRKPD